MKTAPQQLSMMFIFLLLTGWSVWYWSTQPRNFKSPAEVVTACEDGAMTEYCLGFEDGLEMGFEMAMREQAIREFGEYSKGEIIEMAENL